MFCDLVLPIRANLLRSEIDSSKDTVNQELVDFSEDLGEDISNYGPIISCFPTTYPEFVGGQDSLFKYISRNIEYPQFAIDNRIEGRVWLTFNILEDGTVSQVDVFKSVHPELDSVCVIAFRKMPKWIAGNQNGKSIITKIGMPINFVMPERDYICEPEKEDDISAQQKIKTSEVLPAPNLESDIQVDLFPNPASNFFNLELSEISSDMEYQVINSMGQVVKSGHVFGIPERIDSADLEKGLYLVRIVSKELNLDKTERILIAEP